MTDAIESRLADTRVGPGRYGDFVVYRGDLILQQILEYGGHTRPEVAFLSSVTRAGDTVIDIGAHVGTFTIPLARLVGPSGLVCAFEPSPSSFDLLVLNVEVNGLSGVVWPIDRAVSNRQQAFTIEVPNMRNTGGSYLVESEGGLESLTLDGWVEERLADRCIDVIKIDVEGMEPLVLSGARHTLEQHGPCVYLEVNQEYYARYGVTIADVVDALDGWRFFVNRGHRNAASDRFDMVEIDDITAEAATHFDLLAVPPSRAGRLSL